jgi:hypothetical protein
LEGQVYSGVRSRVTALTVVSIARDPALDVAERFDPVRVLVMMVVAIGGMVRVTDM